MNALVTPVPSKIGTMVYRGVVILSDAKSDGWKAVARNGLWGGLAAPKVYITKSDAKAKIRRIERTSAGRAMQSQLGAYYSDRNRDCILPLRQLPSGKAPSVAEVVQAVLGA